VVFCKTCETARLDGPTVCPVCGDVLQPAESARPAATTAEPTAKPPEPVEPATPKPHPYGIERRLTGEVHRYTFQGKTLSLVQWAKEVGIPYATLYYRISNGWTIERALTESLEEERVVEFQGKKLTISGWAKELGIAGPVIRRRLHKGWPLERALSADGCRQRKVRTLSPVTPESEQRAMPRVTPADLRSLNMTGPGAATLEPVKAIEARLVRADEVASVDLEPLAPLPEAVRLIRERCARLDEIDYEIGLLLQERKQLIARLQGEVTA
jgi:hypothetical protein